MIDVPVDLGARAYVVRIMAGGIDDAAAQLGAFARGGRLVVVSDHAVWAAQGPRLLAGLGAIAAEPVLVAPGEGSKSFATLAGLLDRLLALGIERRDTIVAFGGGVVGDLAGFAAAVLKRGCGVVQVPTTLLAQVDSSVGGKTGINVAAGKNLVGAFHQPRFVLVDPDALATLDPRHVRAGYAEIVKYALIEDAGLFDTLERDGPTIIAKGGAARVRGIAAAVAGKAAIVRDDERETGDRRALLNLGHTFGHALEAETGFSDALLHGEAVAVGLALAFDFSAARGLCPDADAQRVKAHLAAVGLPHRLAAVCPGANGAALVDHMRHDKKMAGGTLAFILARGIGRAFVDRGVALDEVAAFLDRQRAA